MKRSNPSLYESTLTNLPLPTFFLSRDLRVRIWNEHAEALFGWKFEEVDGQLPPLIQPEDIVFTEALWFSFLEKQETLHLKNVRMTAKDGLVFRDVELSPVIEEGVVIGAVFCCLPEQQGRDVTSKPVFQELIDLRTAFDEAANVTVFDAQGTITYVNDLFSRLFEYRPEELISRSWRTLLPTGAKELPAIRQSLKGGNAWSGKIDVLTRRGIVKQIQATLIPLRDIHDVPYQFIFIGIDITEKVRHERQLNFVANHNELTGLLNKRGFLDTGEEMFDKADKENPVAFLLFDLDRFKVINDSFGPQIGDLLLTSIAERIENQAEDAIICHPGGDQFGLLINSFGHEAAFRFTRKLQQALQRPYYINGHTLFITCTFGIALYPSESATLFELYRRAELALFAGKAIGAGTIQYLTEEMDATYTRKVQIERALFTALDEHSFHLHFQPIIDLKDKRLAGFEALLRWRHKELGDVPPSEFIPLAEAAALIIPINNWVLLEACDQLKKWHETIDPGLTMAVNLSPQQFQSDTLMRTLQLIVKEGRVKPASLILEVTENVAMLRTKETIERMRLIKSLGFRLSLDDFGTGYSSLQYLRAFPVDELKIDKVFIDGIDQNDNALLDSIIHLGCSLGLNLVAEGVETTSALEYLEQTKCHQMQGFIFSRPLSAAQVEQQFSSQKGG